MTSDSHHDVADVRRELWSLYAALKHGDVEPELAEQQVSVLDSLIDVARLESELKAAEDAAGKKARSWRRLG